MGAPESFTTTTDVGHWIGGRVFQGTGTRRAQVYNPSTGAVAREVLLAGAEDVDAAVAAARAAFPAWADTPPLRRARVLNAFLGLLNQHRDTLAAMITSEHGKVFTDAQGEVTRGIDIVEFACGIPQLLKGDYTEQVSTGIDNWTMRQPLGVAVGITPFNFPVMVPDVDVPGGHRLRQHLHPQAHRDATVASLFMATLLQRPAFPTAVFNVVQATRPQSMRCSRTRAVKPVSFVGSTARSPALYETGTAHGKRCRRSAAPRTTWSCCPTRT
jgi:malonate-semialdehyde dehydrogenase (acetylating)/methylmalonate-semialdehyde dehydrogenase